MLKSFSAWFSNLSTRAKILLVGGVIVVLFVIWTVAVAQATHVAMAAIGD